MFSTGIHAVDHRTPLRTSILNKASKYGNLSSPYIVAVLAEETIDEIDIMEALFGKEQFTVYFSSGSPKGPETTKMSRVPDGVWTYKTGPKNTRLSAVLIVQHLNIWNLSGCKTKLYHNPWASNPYSSVLCQLSQAILQNGKMETVEGLKLSDLLS